jgi:hypothetical protein
MAVNGFQCRFVAFAIVSAYRPGGSKLGREKASASRGFGESNRACEQR